MRAIGKMKIRTFKGVLVAIELSSTCAGVFSLQLRCIYSTLRAV